jgi:hypothetical protein
MWQIRTVHNGFTGAPGYTQHYFDASGSTLGAQSASDAVTPTTPLTQATFGDSALYAGGVGAVTKWVTNSVHGSRRLTGRTFVVPLNATKYESNGTLTSGCVTALRNAAAGLQGHADFGVWGRPVAGANGLFAKAVASNVRDHVAWLSSRRD